MRAVDLIQKKKEGKEHTKEEIYFLIEKYLKGEIEDYQMSAWLMAVYFKGLTDSETAYLTQSFINSGDILDFSDISTNIADKHSTGGVGDKVTLVLIPILASLGVHCAKLSGRGLGFTGGTVDKLESIPNFRVELKNDEFLNLIKEQGAAISSQSPNLTPADGKIYALRDVTATVDNKSLICASVVSKKIASGANSIVLDVKCGSGAFIKTLDDAIELGDLMAKIGSLLNRKIDYIVSSMDEPLGRCVGNAIEVIESIEFLKGNYTNDLYEVTLALAVKTLLNFNIVKDKFEAKKMVDEAIKSSKALEKFRQIIKAQGGVDKVIDDYSLFGRSKNIYEIKSDTNGFIKKVDAIKIAHGAKLLGAGRDKKSDKIDYLAGIEVLYKTGDKVDKNDTIAKLYYNDVNNEKLNEAIAETKLAFKITNEKIENKSIILKY